MGSWGSDKRVRVGRVGRGIYRGPRPIREVKTWAKAPWTVAGQTRAGWYAHDQRLRSELTETAGAHHLPHSACLSRDHWASLEPKLAALLIVWPDTSDTRAER